MALAGTKPKVFIIESLDVEDEPHHRNGKILSRTHTMSGKNSIYCYIRTKQELVKFVPEFERSRYRYLHMSYHDQIAGEGRLREGWLYLRSLARCKNRVRRYSDILVELLPYRPAV